MSDHAFVVSTRQFYRNDAIIMSTLVCTKCLNHLSVWCTCVMPKQSTLIQTYAHRRFVWNQRAVGSSFAWMKTAFLWWYIIQDHKNSQQNTHAASMPVGGGGDSWCCWRESFSSFLFQQQPIDQHRANRTLRPHLSAWTNREEIIMLSSTSQWILLGIAKRLFPSWEW